jgi:hypothetical protein
VVGMLVIACVAGVVVHVVHEASVPPSAAQGGTITYIGTACDVLSGSGCNPRQLAAFADPDPYTPSKTIAKAKFLRAATNRLQTTMDVTVSETASQFAQTTASGFGIAGTFGAVLPEFLQKAFFSGSYAYRQVVQRMWGSDQRYFHAHVSYRYIIFAVHPFFYQNGINQRLWR